MHLWSKLHKILVCMINQWGIEANLEKIWAIIKIRATTRPKEVQSLPKMKAALNCFVSNVIVYCKPFLDVKKFERITEYQEAFEELKKQFV